MKQNEFIESTSTENSENVVLNVSLRDWFAGQALAHVHAYSALDNFEDIASDAYLMADAMLVERAKGKK